jgi:hypothetical protein
VSGSGPDISACGPGLWEERAEGRLAVGVRNTGGQMQNCAPMLRLGNARAKGGISAPRVTGASFWSFARIVSVGRRCTVVSFPASLVGVRARVLSVAAGRVVLSGMSLLGV